MDGGSPDPASLERLRDVVMPTDPGRWPPAPGWIAVILACALIAAACAIVIARRHRRRAYRHAGRSALRRLALLAETPATRDAALAEVPVLLKRVALAAFPRERVAALVGTPWLAFLDASSGSHEFSNGPGRVVVDLAHDPALRKALTSTQIDGLFRSVETWMQRHRAEVEA